MGGKGGWCKGLTILSPSCADYQEIWDLQSPGTQRACAGLTGTGYYCYCHYYHNYFYYKCCCCYYYFYYY